MLALLLRVLLDQLDKLGSNRKSLVVKLLQNLLAYRKYSASYWVLTEISSLSSSRGAVLEVLNNVRSFSTFLISANTSASI